MSHWADVDDMALHQRGSMSDVVCGGSRGAYHLTRSLPFRTERSFHLGTYQNLLARLEDGELSSRVALGLVAALVAAGSADTLASWLRRRLFRPQSS